MKYPTRALLRSIREKPPGTDFWLDDLSPVDALRLAIFLNEIMAAIWMDYGKVIVDYQRSRTYSDFEPPICDIRPPRASAHQEGDIPF
jgi:hypothetical protein